MSIAHYFTLFRILLIPLFPVVYFKPYWFGLSGIWVPVFLIIILLICELTDIFDGIIARKKNQVTDLGKVLDPMADSIMSITVFFTFTQGIVNLPLLVVFVFIYRDFFISTLRTLCAMKGFALAARLSGKIKTIFIAIVVFTILLLMIPYHQGKLSLEMLQTISFIMASLSAIYTIGSALDYIYANRSYIKKAIEIF